MGSGFTPSSAGEQLTQITGLTKRGLSSMSVPKMLNTTLSRICCPKCQAALKLQSKTSATTVPTEVRSGQLRCVECQAQYPIVAGIAVLVDDVRAYFYHHAKGISALVPDAEIPREYFKDYKESLAEYQEQELAEDLESERVNALYLMNHYLDTQGAAWWKPSAGEGSPLFDALIREHWDRGPFSVIRRWIQSESAPVTAVVLGCGVGGLYRTLKPKL